MANPKVKLNSREVEKLLRGEGKYRGVREDLQRRANRMAAAAGPGFVAEVEQGRNRARGAVFTATQAAREAEAKDAALTRAIDAGRGNR